MVLPKGLVVRRRNPLSLDMGWKCTQQPLLKLLYCRNPLSLDMGWKPAKRILLGGCYSVSQSAFAGYGLEVSQV